MCPMLVGSFMPKTILKNIKTCVFIIDYPSSIRESRSSSKLAVASAKTRASLKLPTKSHFGVRSRLTGRDNLHMFPRKQTEKRNPSAVSTQEVCLRSISTNQPGSARKMSTSLSKTDRKCTESPFPPPLSSLHSSPSRCHTRTPPRF
jgi:hypothetical protein